MLESPEYVCRRSGGRGAVVDEQAPGGRGADLSKEGLRVRKDVERSRENQPTENSLQLLPLHSIDAGIAKNPDRKSTRLNSSHLVISYAVFCLKKKKKKSKT